MVCRCVDGGDILLRDVLRDRGYREFPGPDHFVLVPPPGGLDGYIDSLPRRHRNKVRRELRKLREGGVAITVEPLTPDLIRTVAPLLVNLYNRYDIDKDCDRLLPDWAFSAKPSNNQHTVSSHASVIMSSGSWNWSCTAAMRGAFRRF